MVWVSVRVTWSRIGSMGLKYNGRKKLASTCYLKESGATSLASPSKPSLCGRPRLKRFPDIDGISALKVMYNVVPEA